MATQHPENNPAAAHIGTDTAAELKALMLWAEANDPNQYAIRADLGTIFPLTEEQVFQNLQNNIPGLDMTRDKAIIDGTHAIHQEIYQLFSEHHTFEDYTKVKLQELKERLVQQNERLQQTAAKSKEASQAAKKAPEQQKITAKQLEIKSSEDAVRIFELLRVKSYEIMHRPDSDAEKQTLIEFAKNYLGEDQESNIFAKKIKRLQEDPDLASDQRSDEQLEKYAKYILLAQESGHILNLHPAVLNQRIAAPFKNDTKLSQKLLERFPELPKELRRIEKTVETPSEIIKDASLLPLPQQARDIVNAIKLQIIGGQVIDPSLQRLGRVIHNNGKMEDPKEVKAAWHLVQDILTTDRTKNPDYRPDQLREMAKNISGSLRKDMQTRDRGIFHKMAAFELAQVAEGLLKEQHPETKNDRYVGQGFNTYEEVLDNFNHENVGKLTIANLMTKERLVPAAMTIYGGVVGIANLIASIQSKDPDRWLNPWIYGGAGLCWLGIEGYKNNTADSLLHPENRVMNELASITNTPDKFLLSVFTDPKEQALFRALDLSKMKEKQFNGLMGSKKRQQAQLEKQKRDNEKQQVQGGQPTGGEEPLEKESASFFASPKYQISRDELADGQHFSSLFLNQENGDLAVRERKKILEGLPNDSESNFRRYKALAFLYANNIGNADLPQLFVLAEETKNARFQPEPVVKPQ